MSLILQKSNEKKLNQTKELCESKTLKGNPCKNKKFGEQFCKRHTFQPQNKINIIKLTKNYILNSDSYLEYHDCLEKHNNNEKGDLQEFFAKIYFESHKVHYKIDNYYITKKKLPI